MARRRPDRRSRSASPLTARRSWTPGCAPRPTCSSPPRDELVIKVLVASRVPGVDVHDVIQTHRRHVVELMQEWTRLKRDDRPRRGEPRHWSSMRSCSASTRWSAGSTRPTPGCAGPGSSRPSATAPRTDAGRTAAGTEPNGGGAADERAAAEPRVSKVYGSGATAVHALREVDLTVEPGELVAVMGPSGSGKSTLLTIAGSLEEPTDGEVIVGGRAAVAAVPPGACRAAAPLDRLRVPGLQPARRADGSRERVAAPGARRGARRAHARPAAMAVLERLGLAERADRFPDDLSGGERQRVAIARAVVGERHLLLADEPSGALDSANGEAVMRLVRETCQGGVAGVVVTHDAQLASWADRVIFLRDGRIVDQTAARGRIRRRCWKRTRRDDHHPRHAPAARSPRRVRPAVARRPAARSVVGPGGCCAANGASRYWCWRCSPSRSRPPRSGSASSSTCRAPIRACSAPRRRAARHRRSRPDRRRRRRGRRTAPVRHGRGDRPRERAGAGVDHPGRPARPGSARAVQQADAAPGLRAATRPVRSEAAVTASGRDHVRPQGRLDLVGERAAAAGGRDRREPQGPPGRASGSSPRVRSAPRPA